MPLPKNAESFFAPNKNERRFQALQICRPLSLCLTLAVLATAPASASPSGTLGFFSQARQASSFADFLHDHVQISLGTSSEEEPAGEVISSRKTDEGFTLFDWATLGTSFSRNTEIEEEGIFAYGLTGSDIEKTAESISGVSVGYEQGSWSYANEPDLEKTGLSLGYYTGRRLDQLSLTGSLILTTYQNDLKTSRGATANALSNRVMIAGGANRIQRFDSGASLKPYVDILYSYESLAAYSYSDGQAVNAAQTTTGEVSLGLEYATAPNPTTQNRFLIRGEIERDLDAKDVNLANGSTYTPSQVVTGEIGLGWIAGDKDGTSSRRLELTLARLGDSASQEIRLDAIWNEVF